jgi:cob(I)alamin adenosyltransferase
MLYPGEAMTVNLTRIYTRLGDSGETHLGDMSRVPKTHPRIEAYGTVDELNAQLGVALAMDDLPERFAPWLARVQNDLFDVGADLCNPLSDDPPYPPLRITEAYVERLEAWCDEYNEQLPALDSFVLPGGTPGAALLHTARTIARRAERSTWALQEADGERTSPLPAKYLNRLSDLLFILARTANPDGDVKWVPGGNAR